MDSASSSSSCSGGSRPVRRRSRGLALPISDDSDDSSGSPVRPTTSRKRRAALPSESESSSSDSEWQTESENEAPKEKASESPAAKKKVEYQSDSSEGNSEKCPICLLSFSNQDIGTPETCEHPFCADCLTEWAKNVNTCPVDRMEFKTILVRRKVGGKVFKRIPVNPRRPSEEDLFIEDPTFCEICRLSSSEETMLLCDLCDLGYHMDCLTPPLTEVPVNEWFCPECSAVGLFEEVDILEGEVDFLWEELVEMGQPNGPRPSQLRSQRARERRGLRHRQNNETTSTDQNMPSTSRQDDLETEQLTTSRNFFSRKKKTTKRKKPKKRKTTRRIRNVVVEYEIKDGEKFPIKTRKVKRKTRRKKIKRQPRTAARRKLVKSSVRGRLAEQFGNIDPSNGRFLQPAIAPRLSLFGNRNELEYFEESDNEISTYNTGGTSIAVAPRSVASAILESRRQIRRKMISVPSPTYASSAPDLLSSILESQSLLHSKETSISVVNGGALVIKPKPSKKSNIPDNKSDAVDVRNTETQTHAKETPMYPGSGRGGGGGGGGNWRGGNRDYQNSGNYNRGGNRNYGGGSNYSGGNSGNYHDSNYDDSNSNYNNNRSFSNNNPWHNNCDQDNQRNHYGSYERSPMPLNRQNNRDRESQYENQRYGNQNPNNRQSQWHNRMGMESNQSYHNQSRNQSASDISDPVDMTVSRGPNVSHAGIYNAVQHDNNITQPPIIRFQKPDLSDDEPEMSGPVDIYDPTEPTIGDSGSDDEDQRLPANNYQPVLTIVSPPRPPNTEMCESENNDEVTSTVVDNPPQNDDDNDLDDSCPNFSIYTSTSVDLLSAKEPTADVNEPKEEDQDEDLVQDDGNDYSDDADAPPEDTTNTAVTKSTPSTSITTAVPTIAPMNMFKVDKKINFFGQKNESTDKPKHTIKINLLKPIIPESNLNCNKIDVDDIENELARLQSDCDMPESAEKINADGNNFEKFTELVSDAEDERSYTPCLDENRSNKSKDTTFESEKETSGIGGMDTEMISEDEGNELFSDSNRMDTSEKKSNDIEDTEVKKQKIKAKVKELLEQPEIILSDDDKKKKKKERRVEKESTDRSNVRSSKSDSDMAFKKLSKTGKGRNYRDRDDKHKGKENRRSKSHDSDRRDKPRERKKEKRKDIERYDVRNVISEKSRRIKDVFGRDTSRPRSKSAESAFGSPAKSRRSLSKRRSPSVNQRSVSIVRSASKNKSLSPKRRALSGARVSISRNRRSTSKGRKRSTSRPKRNRSISRGRKSISPRLRRGLSPGRRRSISPRGRKPLSPRKRSPSPRIRSPIRGRRSISPRNRRSRSLRHRSASRQRNRRVRSRSRSPRRPSPRSHRPKSPKRRISRRSRSKGRSTSRNRSKSRGKKTRKTKRNRSNSSKRRTSKSPIKKLKRRKLRSPSGELVLSSSPSRGNGIRSQWDQPNKSPLYQDVWSSDSHSISPSRRSRGWTPPVEKTVEPQNLRVILTTKEKLKKRDKKKKTSKKNKAIDRIGKNNSKDLPPSKEVFTSGNNILVSVSFNKNQEPNKTLLSLSQDVVPKRKKRKSDLVTKQKKEKKEKSKKKRAEKLKRAKDIENKKPVAIIDLDRSPFKELTPSPKAVIVLSDSDNGEKEAELVQRQEILRGELRNIEFPPTARPETPADSPVRENFTAPTGPKTPPEPAIKFTIMSKNNLQLRPVNPLHEEEDDQPEETQEKEQPAQETRLSDSSHKGPNTPPDPPNSPPSSPDAYNPFEPTKSGSATPEMVCPSPLPPPPLLQVESEKVDIIPDEIMPIQCITLEAAQKSNLSADDVIQARPISPMEKVLALLKSTSNNLTTDAMLQLPFVDQTFESLLLNEPDTLVPNASIPANQSPERSIPSINALKPTQVQSLAAIVKPSSPKLIYSTVAPTIVTATSIFPNPTIPRVSVYSTGTSPIIHRAVQATAQRIILPSPTKSSPLKTQQNKLFLTKPSPIKSTPIKPMPSKTLISKLPLPSVKPMPNWNQKSVKPKGQNGNDVIEVEMDMDSPYSPGSSDFGDLFEPPPDTPKTQSSSQPTYAQKSGKQDMFDALFGAKPKKTPTPKNSVKPVQKQKAPKIPNPNKIDEEMLKIIDDMPSSAIDLQNKTRYLKKLHRQERIVEEVKIVLKPHFNKKHINKEVYKEIMRRAVPKICHSRSQEINPAKIHAFIEDYVRKFRKKALYVKGV